MNPSSPAMLPSRSFREWCCGNSLQEMLKRAEADVRAKPTDAEARWLLLELLCITSSWDRALKQLQTYATLTPPEQTDALIVSGLLRAESQREDVFMGRLPPTPFTPMPAGWMRKLADALARNAAQDHEGADQLRAPALLEAPELSGEGNLGEFNWITDSDTRLGPVCELIMDGHYRWIAFSDLRHISIQMPTRLMDLIWANADIVLRDGSRIKAHIPMRYPASPLANDAMRLSRETVWRDVGATGVFADGQKTWMTDCGDWPLLDVRHCEFHEPDAATTAPAMP